MISAQVWGVVGGECGEIGRGELIRRIHPIHPLTYPYGYEHACSLGNGLGRDRDNVIHSLGKLGMKQGISCFFV